MLTLKRVALIPELRKVDEAGVSDYDASNWYALVVLPTMPRPGTMMKLHNDTVRRLERTTTGGVMTMLTWRCIVSPVVCACLLPAATALAQDVYPDRPVRLIVPFPPGGGTDANARAIAREVESILGQPMVVDNRGGANSVIGTDILARATPNGYTLMHVSMAFAINPNTRKNLPYDALRDFTPITNALVGQGSALVVNPAVPARSVKELIALAKREKLSFGSPGVGNVLHLIAEAFNARAGIQLIHVPYKGSGPSMTALMGGEVQMSVVPPIIAMPHIKAERLRALAYSGVKRLAALPDLPTISEAGLTGFALDTGWHAWFAPANTPNAIIQRIYDAIKQAVQVPKVRDFLLSGGYEPVADAPAVFAKNLPLDIKRWGELVRIANIKPE